MMHSGALLLFVQGVSSIDPRCNHGHFDANLGQCVCDEGWRLSGPTDTINFLKGTCEQSSCTSDEQCMTDLGFDDDYSGDTAVCYVHTWNCYCGWKYAFGHTWTGYETQHAKCMGVLYNLSFTGTYWSLWYMQRAWAFFLALAFIALPFGQSHVRCQHKDPDMFRMAHFTGALHLFGWNYNCDGQCADWNNTNRYYDWAWSLYFIDLGLWTYGFLLAFWCVFMVSWSVAMWLIVAAIVIIACVVACVGAGCACIGAACGEGGGGGDCNCNCDCGGGHGGCDCCAGSNPHGGGGGCCDCCEGGGGNQGMTNSGNCCDACCGTGSGGNSGLDNLFWYNYYSTNTDVFYSGGPSPDCRCDCGGCRFCHIMRPIAWIITKFPKHPPNVWGGCFGRYVTKTHPACRQGEAYQGGVAWIDALSFRARGDLHSNTDWRDAVHHYIYNLAPDAPRTAQRPSSSRGSPTQQSMTQPLLQRQASTRRDVPTRNQGGIMRQGTMQRIGANLIASEDASDPPVPLPFDQQRDHVVESSFDDYKKNECWICCGENNDLNPRPGHGTEWHLWVGCGHMFCATCSSEMLRRRMPCPLCRRASANVKYGPKFNASAP